VHAGPEAATERKLGQAVALSIIGRRVGPKHAVGLTPLRGTGQDRASFDPDVVGFTPFNPPYASTHPTH